MTIPVGLETRTDVFAFHSRCGVGVATPIGSHTNMDPSFGQDPSVGHFKFLTQFSLNHYQIEYMMSSATL